MLYSPIFYDCIIMFPLKKIKLVTEDMGDSSIDKNYH